MDPCLLCGIQPSSDSGLCPPCQDGLPRNFVCCPRCAAPLGDPSPRLCGNCLKTAPSFNLVHAPFLYTPPLDKLITGLKFNNKLHHARILAHLLGQSLIEAGIESGLDSALQRHDRPRPQCLVPVPLHNQRLRERGYNQSLEIARDLAKTLNIKLEKDLIRRVKPTLPQTELQLNERRANVRGAFKVWDIRHYQHIAIIDDVITSAQTVEEVAKCFREAGVRTVEVWAVARVKLGK